MPSIVRYKKVVDSITTHQLAEPYDVDGSRLITELCTLRNGYTYVSIPDGVTLPPQPADITVSQVTLDGVLIGKIKLASPHVRLAKKRETDKVHRYSARDKLALDDLMFFGLAKTVTLEKSGRIYRLKLSASTI